MRVVGVNKTALQMLPVLLDSQQVQLYIVTKWQQMSELQQLKSHN